ncbi:MAG: hypothetical protein NTX33_11345 [Propionibacteriales bacterium]|nr:hypothetical protein [Propionibacteriales bacterium]
MDASTDPTPSTRAAAALVAGGLIAVVSFVPFTAAHGPTSYNLEREVLGWDMHDWGFLLGVLPPLLVATGLWSLRLHLAGGRRAAFRALTVICVAMSLFATMNLAFRALGPPVDLFLLAPASVVVAMTTRQHGAIRAFLSLLAAAYCVGLAIALIPQETSDDFGGYRIFGSIAYAGAGALWAALGATLLLRRR